MAALAYLALALHVSSLFPKTTDQISYFQAGVAVAHGHFRLGGWRLTPPDFWTSDIALSAALSLFWRLLGRPEASPFLLMLQPAMMWTAVVASGIALARLRGARWPGIAVISVLLGAPLFAMPVAYFTTLSAIHLGSVLYAAWALHWAARACEAPSAHGRRRARTICAILLTSGVFGDPLVIIGATLPILLFAVFTRHIALATTAVIATGAARALLALNTATGGFQTAPLPLQFAEFADLGTNFAVTLHDILVLFGADPTGRAVGDSLPELLRGALLLCVLAAWTRTFEGRETVLRRQAATQPWPFLLAVGAVLTALALWASDRIELEAGSIATARYLFPLWFDLSALAACVFGRTSAIGCLATVALVTTLLSDAQTLPRHATGILSDDDNALVARLEAEGLDHGIGSWWASRAFDTASFGKLHIVPASAGGACGLSPLVQIGPSFTLSAVTRAPFFVLVPSPRETYGEGDVRACFGDPRRVFRQGRYDVLVYPGHAG